MTFSDQRRAVGVPHYVTWCFWINRAERRRAALAWCNKLSETKNVLKMCRHTLNFHCSNRWQLWAILGNTWQLWAIPGNTGQYMVVMSNTGQYWAIISNNGQLWAILGTYGLLKLWPILRQIAVLALGVKPPSARYIEHWYSCDVIHGDGWQRSRGRGTKMAR